MTRRASMNYDFLMQAIDVINKLGLQALEPEGGWFAQTYVSSEKVKVHGAQERSLATAIYYLITPDNFSRLHRLKHVEIYHFYAGAKAELTQVNPDGSWNCVRLGNDIAAGDRPQHVVHPHVWQAVTIAPGEKIGWTLLGTTMVPGFDFADFEMADQRSMLEKFPAQKQRILKLTK